MGPTPTLAPFTSYCTAPMEQSHHHQQQQHQQLQQSAAHQQLFHLNSNGLSNGSNSTSSNHHHLITGSLVDNMNLNIMTPSATIISSVASNTTTDSSQIIVDVK